MSDRVSIWLQGLDLGEYAEVFSVQRIDWDTLVELTDADLKELAIPLGPRRKLLKAIRSEFQDGASSAGAVPSKSFSDTPASPAHLPSWERLPGERKPVTMLFADIADSTALTEKLDAEETHDLIYGATQRMCAAVESNHGTVCRLMGDGVMAMFGAPVASEHHAVEACEAALEMQQAIREYVSDVRSRCESGLRIRVGLHSGEVVVLTGGEGEQVEHDASGPTVPIAARMEQAAGPGEVYLSEATRALAGGRIEAQSLDPVSLKGISEPVPVFVLRRVRLLEEVVPDVARTPFVGRRAELVQFRGMLETCIDEGRGQTVLVRGEAGIGKTRLVEECSRTAAKQGVPLHRGLVLPFGVGKGQDAIRSLVRSLLGIAPGSGEDERRREASAALADGRLASAQAVFLNDLLDLAQPTQQRALYDAMDNRTRHEGKQSVASELLAATSRIQPIVAVIEDVHWADSITLSHLAVLTRTVAECPAMLLLTSRVEGDPLGQSWRATTKGSPFCTIDLGPLREQESMTLVSEFFDIDDRLTRSCLERAAGNPLFLEQLLRLAQAGAVEGLPDSIQSLVAARMDRLSPRDKRALQAASVVGQRFSLDLVRHLANDPDYQCNHLISHSLVRPEGESYLIAHALIQEGVYASVLRRDRVQLHKAAADWFSDSDLTLRAEHLDRAGDPAAANAYLLAARGQAKAYRFESALRLADRGLQIVCDGREKHALTCLKGELLHDTGASGESIATYRAALDSAEDEVSKCEALVGVAAGLRLTTEYTAAMRCLDEAQPIATKHELPKLLAQMHHLRGNLCFSLGDIERCGEEHSLALRCARATGLGELEARALGGLGDAAYAAGRMRTALENFTGCLDLCREQAYGRIEIAYRPMMAFSLLYLCRLDQALSEVLAAIEAARKVRHDRAEMNAIGAIGHIAASSGDYGVFAQYAEVGLAIAKRLGAKTFMPVFLLYQGLMEEASGRRDEARKILHEASLLTEGLGEAFNGGRVQGAIALLHHDDPECRDRALLAGESYLRRGSVGHNHLWFYRLGMESLLKAHEWERVEIYAQALQDFTRREPLPWSDFFIAWGRALATFGRGSRADATIQELHRLRDEAARIGFKPALPALEEALSSI